ncbi:MAG: cupin domain-containing protein [Planctomycetota bacterium]|jgi:mannose-6-phosphate isomerase-like protein (cupin superfamily)
MSAEIRSENYRIVHMGDIEPVPCPCGTSRRAFADAGESPASLHIVDIKTDPQTHYHKSMTEVYHVLEGEGVIELDGESHPIRPGSTVMIHPGCRHRAVGDLKIINVAIPAFDPEDEWFD